MRTGDFRVFIEASKLLAVGESPYHQWLYMSEGSFCLYFYSPFWAFILIPFTYLPSFIVNLFWLLGNVFFAFRIFQILKQYLPKDKLSKSTLFWGGLLTVLFCLRFILYNFDMIQMTIFILWGILESIFLMDKGRQFWGGLILALVINIKLLPLVILPYLIFRKQWTGLGYTLLFSVFFLLVPGIYLGWNTNDLFLSEWWESINPSNPEHVVETDMGPHSLTALIPNLFAATQHEHSAQRLIVDLGVENAILIMNIIRLFLIGLTLYFLRWIPFQKAKSKFDQIREISYIILLIPLIFPHQQKYAFVLVLPAVYYLIHYLMFNFEQRQKMKRPWYFVLTLLLFSFIIMTMSTDGIIGKEWGRLAQYYKLITWGTLALIPALIIARPKKVEIIQVHETK